MSKEKISTIIRHALTLIGAIMLSYGIGSDVFFASMSGGIMGLVSLFLTWNVEGKTKQERLNGVIRHLVAMFGAFAVGFPEIVTTEKFQAVMDIVTNYSVIIVNTLMFIWSIVEKTKKA